MGHSVLMARFLSQHDLKIYLLLQDLVRDGKIVGREPLADARARHAAVLAELPGWALQLSRGYPAIPTTIGPDADAS